MQRTSHIMTIMLLILAMLIPLGCAPDPEEARTVQTPTPPSATATPTSPATVTPEPTPPSSTVTIFPTSGPPGTNITVEGEGWPSDTEIQLDVGQEDEEPHISYDVQIAADGTFTRTLLIPIAAEPGERWTVVGMLETPSLEITSDAFQVIEQEYHGTVEISPHSGPPGTTVQVTAQDFPPNTQVEIGIGPPDAWYDAVATAQTDGEGRVDTEITLSDFVDPDSEWVIVVAAEHRPTKAVSEIFNVTTPSPTPTAEARIYLVAVGDDGQLGKRFGCNDSLVPVQIQIDGDADPATAALNKLLSIESREHESTELYNALYQSDLTAEEVRIANGEAIVELSGTLRISGVCDDPRVREQLQQTVLEYVEVEEVSIIIDDTPLEDLLGEGPPEG